MDLSEPQLYKKFGFLKLLNFIINTSLHSDVTVLILCCTIDLKKQKTALVMFRLHGSILVYSVLYCWCLHVEKKINTF